MTETYTRDSDKIEIPAEWIESGKQGEILYNNKALRFVCNKTLDAFVAELEQQTWELSENQGVVVKLEVIQQTAKRMKGEGI